MRHKFWQNCKIARAASSPLAIFKNTLPIDVSSSAGLSSFYTFNLCMAKHYQWTRQICSWKLRQWSYLASRRRKSPNSSWRVQSYRWISIHFLCFYFSVVRWSSGRAGEGTEANTAIVDILIPMCGFNSLFKCVIVAKVWTQSMLWVWKHALEN